MKRRGMTEREAFELRELAIKRFEETGGLCEVCGKSVLAGHAQMAHRIPQKFLERYGKAVTHHPRNLVLVDCSRCNDSVSLSEHPLEMDELAASIEAELNGE